MFLQNDLMSRHYVTPISSEKAELKPLPSPTAYNASSLPSRFSSSAENPDPSCPFKPGPSGTGDFGDTPWADDSDDEAMAAVDTGIAGSSKTYVGDMDRKGT